MSLPDTTKIAAAVDKVRRAIQAKLNITTVSTRQQKSLLDPGVPSNLCVSQVVLPAPPPERSDVCEVLFSAIRSLKEGQEKFHRPPALDVKAEWVECRSQDEPSSNGLSKENGTGYYNLRQENVGSSVVVIYLHGGGYMYSNSQPPPPTSPLTFPLV